MTIQFAGSQELVPQNSTSQLLTKETDSLMTEAVQALIQGVGENPDHKPRERLKPGEVYQTKPQIAARMMRELLTMGFQFELVLADSLSGESE